MYDDGSVISLVHKFDDLESETKMPNDILKLLQDNPLPTTAYVQAKRYFDRDDKKAVDQNCPQYFCDKKRYSIDVTGKEDMNDNVSIYSTIPPIGSMS